MEIAPGAVISIYLTFVFWLLIFTAPAPAFGNAIHQVQFILELYDTIELEKDRVNDLEIINGRLPHKKPLSSPYEIIKNADEQHREDGDGVVEWIAGYSGGALGFEIALIIAAPIAIAQLLKIWRKFYIPEVKFKDTITDFPLVPLANLQQTQDELRVTREKRNGVEWLSTKFIILASDNYIDLKEIGKKAQKQDTGQNSPWMLLNLLVKFNGLYALNQIETKQYIRQTEGADSSANLFKISEHFDAAGNFVPATVEDPHKKRRKRRVLPYVPPVEKKSAIVQTNSKSLFMMAPESQSQRVMEEVDLENAETVENVGPEVKQHKEMHERKKSQAEPDSNEDAWPEVKPIVNANRLGHISPLSISSFQGQDAQGFIPPGVEVDKFEPYQRQRGEILGVKSIQRGPGAQKPIDEPHPKHHLHHHPHKEHDEEDPREGTKHEHHHHHHHQEDRNLEIENDLHEGKQHHHHHHHQEETIEDGNLGIENELHEGKKHHHHHHHHHKSKSSSEEEIPEGQDEEEPEKDKIWHFSKRHPKPQKKPKNK